MTNKTIDEIIQEFEKEYSKEEYEVDGQTFSQLCGIKEYLKSILSLLQSETEKRVRKETIEEIIKFISDEIKTAHGLDCDKIVRKYPLSGGYRECECGASSKEYAFIKVKDKLTNLLNEKE